MTDCYTKQLLNPIQHPNKHSSSNNPKAQDTFHGTNKVFKNLSVDSPQDSDKASPLPLVKNLNSPSSLLLDKVKLVPHSP